LLGPRGSQQLSGGLRSNYSVRNLDTCVPDRLEAQSGSDAADAAGRSTDQPADFSNQLLESRIRSAVDKPDVKGNSSHHD
jgi:hypothetical protein